MKTAPATPRTSNFRPRFETRQELYKKFQANARKLGLDDSKENIELSVLETLAKRQEDAPGRFLTTKEVAKLYRAERLPSTANVTPNQGPYEALIEVRLGKHVFQFVEDGFADHVIAANEDKVRKSREERAEQLLRQAACDDLFCLFRDDKLPADCQVLSVNEKEVRIQDPYTLYILNLSLIPKAERKMALREKTVPAKAAPAVTTEKSYGKRSRRPRAEVHEFTLADVDAGWEDEDTVAA